MVSSQNTESPLSSRPASRLCLMALAMATVLVGGLSGCAVGPDYKGAPDASMPVAYKELAGWKQAQPADLKPRGDWWSVYEDATLNQLMPQVQVNNQTVKQFEAAYRSAVAAGDAARASFWPTLSLGLSANRSASNTSNLSGVDNTTTTSRSSVKNNYSQSLDASWEPDIWGKVRRSVEAQDAATQASEADLAGALLSAQATLAQDYFSLRVLDSQKTLYQQTVDAYQKSLTLTQNQYQAGIVTRSDVAQAQTQLLNAQAQLTDLEVSRAQMEHAIATLLGKAPADFSLPVAPLTAKLPGVPVGLPSALLERRPDVASAERAVAKANANIGVATAAMFPALSLSASGGYQNNSFAQWFNAPSQIWSLGASLAQPLFEGGLLKAGQTEAKANYDQVVATYRQTVLGGLQEVEDNLVALRVLDDEAVTRDQAVAAARDAQQLAQNQYKAGTTTYLTVASAQATALSSEVTALQLQGRQFSAHVLLVKALGGGWNGLSGEAVAAH
ncbi:efflux transporter outer membrane subunit [Amantichitinum ursilacus]|uniref:Outer membrane protein OprM n=1 Tax=Amantichitinum ursilacus TaxID=857265 RepID=A0A0N1JRQ4_9NEIS|nr:efflux transporter outer membrane subunit [Amantichitinum ursilacus]KPC49891.1 Outer membrane protein OprM precursor [Amantichitinum ursilacus]